MVIKRVLFVYILYKKYNKFLKSFNFFAVSTGFFAFRSGFSEIRMPATAIELQQMITFSMYLFFNYFWKKTATRLVG